jgi:ABC-type branched-subunit amino acid transport system substrate-binding protein/mono/diheme cytochrome c family protein
VTRSIAAVIARAAALVALLLALTAAAGELTPAQQRGKRLYLGGESSAGRKVTALIGADDLEVAATVVPCAGCHGRDGRGKPEGGVRPANVQWDALVHAAANGTRPAYTKPLLKRAIAMGVGPAGTHLQNTMPRYRMAIEDMNDLLAYLEVLSSDREPGLTDDAVRIGAVLPPDHGEARAVRETLAAYFDRINREGGIFGRRIDARFATTAAGPPLRRAAALQAFLDEEQPFAIAAAWLNGAEEAMSAVAERGRVPMVVAFATHLPAGDRYVFQLLAGDREQSLALVAAAAGENARAAQIAIVADEPTNGVAATVRTDLVAAGCTHVDITTAPPPAAQFILFLAAPVRLPAVLATCAAAASPPIVLVPAAHSGGDLTAAPPALDRRILVGLPSSPNDVSAEGRAELRALGATGEHGTACRVALASAKLLVEALRRDGRDVDRDAVVATLETFYETPTSLTPPVSWSPGHHVGTRAVLVVAIDLRGKQWIDRGWW